MSALIPDYRSADNLRAAVAAVDVEHAPDLQPGYWPEPPGRMAGVTWCNVAACRILRKLCVPIPEGIRANALSIWFDSAAARAMGWYGCTEQRAIERAAVGFPVVAVWFNPNPPPHDHGHIGVGVPGPAGATELHVAAAGASNHSDIHRSGTFGPYVPEYFTID